MTTEQRLAELEHEIAFLKRNLKGLDDHIDELDKIDRSSAFQETASATAVKQILLELLVALGMPPADVEIAFQARRKRVLARMLEETEKEDAALAAAMDERMPEDVPADDEVPPLFIPRVK